MGSIKNLEINMEKYESDVLYRIPNDLLSTSEMADTERRFLNGLIRYHKPSNLLEIGVARGGGSLIMLNAIRDIPYARLTSIDITEIYYTDIETNRDVPVGASARKLYNPDAPESKWKLITGKDPVEVIESLDTYFDFCIIDTLHLHPAESLNFLTIFPYLSDGAIVVLHDTALYTNYPLSYRSYYATKLLFDSVVADKLIPKEEYSYEMVENILPNIGAFRITQDTKKYISDAFSMLRFRWGYTPNLLDVFLSYFEKHYDDECVWHYKRAVETHEAHIVFKLNTIMGAEKESLNFHNDKSASNNEVANLVFYGAGHNCRSLLDIFKTYGNCLPHEIWDAFADSVESIDNIPVVLPRFDSADSLGDCSIVITIRDKQIAYPIKFELMKAGFSNVHIWQEM